MTTYIRPAAVARDDADMIAGWNISPNTGYQLQISATPSGVVVILLSANGSTLLGSGTASIGTAQPVTITPMSGQTLDMADATLGWHILLTTAGSEGDRTITMDAMVDLSARTHPVYADDDLALAVGTADINAGTHYTQDVTASCPLGFGAGVGDTVSVPVDGSAVIGQVESITWTATPDGATTQTVIRRHSAIAPEAPIAPPTPPSVIDDAAETDAATEASGNVLTNDDEGLTVVAVEGLGSNVGVVVAGSNGGEFTIAADGAWTFDPSGDFSALTGTDTATTSVSYHASDGESEASATLTVTVSSAEAQPWTPAEITTALWLDTSDASDVTLSGVIPTAIADQSGFGRNATANAAGSYLTANQNGLNAVSLSSSAFAISMAQTASDFSFFIACNPATATGAGGNGRYFLDVQTGRLIFAQVAGVNSLNKVGFYDGAWKEFGAATTGAQILEYVLDDAGAVCYRNGTSIGTAAYTQKAIGGNVRLFKHNSESSAYADGKFFECVLIVGAVSTDTRQKIEGYLAHKWGLADTLPFDHPYKSAAPML